MFFGKILYKMLVDCLKNWKWIKYKKMDMNIVFFNINNYNVFVFNVNIYISYE